MSREHMHPKKLLLLKTSCLLAKIHIVSDVMFILDIFCNHKQHYWQIECVQATNDVTSHTVKQYHFTAWPEDGAPSSGAGMIDLIDQVTRTQAHTGNKPVIVHCR